MGGISSLLFARLYLGALLLYQIWNLLSLVGLRLSNAFECSIVSEHVPLVQSVLSSIV